MCVCVCVCGEWVSVCVCMYVCIYIYIYYIYILSGTLCFLQSNSVKKSLPLASKGKNSVMSSTTPVRKSRTNDMKSILLRKWLNRWEIGGHLFVNRKQLMYASFLFYSLYVFFFFFLINCWVDHFSKE